MLRRFPDVVGDKRRPARNAGVAHTPPYRLLYPNPGGIVRRWSDARFTGRGFSGTPGSTFPRRCCGENPSGAPEGQFLLRKAYPTVVCQRKDKTPSLCLKALASAWAIEGLIRTASPYLRSGKPAGDAGRPTGQIQTLSHASFDALHPCIPQDGNRGPPSGRRYGS